MSYGVSNGHVTNGHDGHDDNGHDEYESRDPK